MSELYTILKLGWFACNSHLPQFTAFSAAYSSPLVGMRLAEIDAAELLPDYQARNATAQNLRNDLISVNDSVLLAYMKLERYITYAFPANQHTALYDAAGKGYYAEAQNLNWDSSAAMLVSMNNFVTANSVQLQLNSNMPSAFVTDLSVTKTLFDDTHQDFLNAENAAFVATETKVEANNLCYQNLIEMFKDAKYLGFSSATMKSFTFASLLQLVSNGTPSKVKGFVTDLVTGLPLAGVTVELTNLGVSVVTDSLGEYVFNSVPYGVYNVFAQITGYQDFTGVVNVVPSSTSSNTIFNFTMAV